MQTERQVHVLQGHSNDVNDCDFSSTGLLATCSSDKSIRVWSFFSDEHQFTQQSYSPLTYHTYSVRGVRFSPCSAKLLSCSTDGSAVVWSVKSGVILATIRHLSEAPLRCSCFSPDGTLIATAGDDSNVCLWSADDASPIVTLTDHEETVTCLSFTSDSAVLASGSTQGDVMLWRLAHTSSSAFTTVWAAHDLGVVGLDFLPRSDGSRAVLASCGHDASVRLWTMDERDQQLRADRVLWSGRGTSMMLRFSADASLLAAAAGEKTVQLWNTSDWSFKCSYCEHARYVTSCCVSPDGVWLASGSNDRSVRVVRLESSAASSSSQHRTPTSSTFQSKEVESWSCDDVVHWLRYLGLAQYSEAFRSRHMDGALLMKMTEQQLTDELTVDLVGHRSKLLRQLERARAGKLAPDLTQPPDEFFCPITRDIMRDPVVCSDGYSYERSAIEAWLKQDTTSPMTKEPLDSSCCVPNRALRSLVNHWRTNMDH